MSRFEKGLLRLIQENRIEELTNYIDKKLSSRIFRKKNEKELLRLLPTVIANTNNNNCNWIKDNYILIFRDRNFINAIINNISGFNFQNSDYILDMILTHMQSMNQAIWDYNMLKKLDDSILECPCELTSSTIEKIHAINHLLRTKYPDLESYMFRKYFLNEKTFDETLRCSYMIDSIDKKIIYKNIEYILEELKPSYLFKLKEYCEEDKEATLKIKRKIDESPKKYIKIYMKNEYKKFMENKEEVLKNYKDRLEEALENAYQIIEDTCRNEDVNISDIKGLPKGEYSKPLLIGNKVVKIGKKRETPHFHNNPYINAIGKRKEYIINEDDSFVIESNELLDTNSIVTDEELYQLWKKFRKLGLIWIDVANRNVGRLLKDNTFSWKLELSPTDEELGLKAYRGPKIILKKGNIVTSDNDMIYDEEELKALLKERTIKNPLVKRFEKRYQEEQMSEALIEELMTNPQEERKNIEQFGRKK